jgi:hypothetical protein
MTKPSKCQVERVLKVQSCMRESRHVLSKKIKTFKRLSCVD